MHLGFEPTLHVATEVTTVAACTLMIMLIINLALVGAENKMPEWFQALGGSQL